MSSFRPIMCCLVALLGYNAHQNEGQTDDSLSRSRYVRIFGAVAPMVLKLAE